MTFPPSYSISNNDIFIIDNNTLYYTTTTIKEKLGVRGVCHMGRCTVGGGVAGLMVWCGAAWWLAWCAHGSGVAQGGAWLRTVAVGGSCGGWQVLWWLAGLVAVSGSCIGAAGHGVVWRCVVTQRGRSCVGAV
jgi:hypothetical protein